MRSPKPAAAFLTNAKTMCARSSRDFSEDALRAVIGLMSIGLPASAYAQAPDFGSAVNFAVLAVRRSLSAEASGSAPAVRLRDFRQVSCSRREELLYPMRSL
jgi:hypothetical protein